MHGPPNGTAGRLHLYTNSVPGEVHNWTYLEHVRRRAVLDPRTSTWLWKRHRGRHWHAGFAPGPLDPDIGPASEPGAAADRAGSKSPALAPSQSPICTGTGTARSATQATDGVCGKWAMKSHPLSPAASCPVPNGDLGSHHRTRRSDDRRLSSGRAALLLYGAHAHRLGRPLSLRPLSPRPCKAAAPKGPAFCFLSRFTLDYA